MTSRVVRVGHDEGSGTIWVACVVLLLAPLMLAGSGVSVVVAARHTAQAAADLAALSAASAAAVGGRAACAVAASIAAANRARLAGCTADPLGVVVVRVRAAVGWPANRFGVRAATAQARAGPAAPSGPP